MNKLNILYEDNHIIVVVKPENMLSQGDITGDVDLLSLVKDYIKVKYNKPGNVYLGLVHRLDRPVGGIMVFAKTSKAASRLSKCIKEHKGFKKSYLAVITGIIDSDSGCFKDKLKKLSNGNTIVSNDGKDSLLYYKVLSRNYSKRLTLVEVNLVSGRHHQIRVQFASRGYPLYGDCRYGDYNNEQLCLFAHKLEFIHPVTKEVISFSALPLKKGGWTYFTM